MLKHIISILCCVCVNVCAFAQSSSLFGKIVDGETNIPLKNVVVTLEKCNLWAISDAQGNFIFKEIPQGGYKLFFSYLGYKEEVREIDLSDSTDKLYIKLYKNSLALKEIIVSSQENRRLHTSSIINEMTISHIQASCLEDLMQLLPGNISSNPSLKDPNYLSIREIVKGKRKSDPALSLGTSVVVDNMQLSNDANLQFLTSSNYLMSSTYINNVAKGVDAREIPSSNIESVEVIRGVASAEYGDMTSGVIIVKTKAGVSPLNVMMKTDAYTKQVAVGQGISIADGGVVNYDVDYTDFYKDLRSDSKSYRRLTSQLRYSNTYFEKTNPLTFNLKMNFGHSADKNKADKDAVGNEKYQFSSTNLGLNIFGKGVLNKSWISEFNYVLNANYSQSETQIVKIENLSGYSKGAVSTLRSGEFLVDILPSEYYSDLQINGKPLYINAKLSASLLAKYEEVRNSVLWGFEWKSTGNLGKGKDFDYSKAYNPRSVNSVRKRDFRDIPFLHTYSFFVEDKVSYATENTSLMVQAGARFNNLIASQGIDKNHKFTFEPRFNTEYRLYDMLSFRAGFGINYKYPTLVHLYPDNVYFDRTSFVNDDIMLTTTKVLRDVANDKLKPMKNIKKEFGITFMKDELKVSITAFMEDFKDALSFSSVYDVVNYNRYITDNTVDKVEYINSQLVQNGIPLEYNVVKDFSPYTVPQNTYSYKKKGIEYTINCGEYKPINTSLIVNGAYFYNQKINEEPYFAVSQLNNKKEYIGLYPSGKGMNSERFNSTFRFITHLPQLRLVLTCSAHVVWTETYKRIYDSEYVTFGEDNITINPIAYLDKEGDINKITSSNIEMPELKPLIITSMINPYYKESYPISTQFNLKLSKEIGRYANMSFYVNNIFNHIQRVKLEHSESYVYRNQPMFFGAMLKMKF